MTGPTMPPSSEGCDCDAGALPWQTYGEADLPDGAVPIQACDNCRRFNGAGDITADEQAARDYAARHGGEVGWADGPIVDNDGAPEELHGEWYVIDQT